VLCLPSVSLCPYLHAVLHELPAHKSVLSSASHWLRPQLVASTGWAAHSMQHAGAAAGEPAGPALLTVLIPEEQLDAALAVLELVYKGPGMQLPLDSSLLLQVGVLRQVATASSYG
jgi:hypothetical protein